MYSCLDMISETQHDKVYVVGVCVNHFIQNIYLCYYYSTRITRIRAKSLFQLYTTSPKRCFQTIFWLKFDFSLFSYFSWITHFFLFFMNNTLFSLKRIKELEKQKTKQRQKTHIKFNLKYNKKFVFLLYSLLIW